MLTFVQQYNFRAISLDSLDFEEYNYDFHHNINVVKYEEIFTLNRLGVEICLNTNSSLEIMGPSNSCPCNRLKVKPSNDLTGAK